MAVDVGVPVTWYSIGTEGPVTPDVKLPQLPAVVRGSLVVVEGRAPIWLYGLAFHKLHGSPAGVIGVYDPKLGVVIVAAHVPGFREGEILDLDPPSKQDDRKGA